MVVKALTITVYLGLKGEEELKKKKKERNRGGDGGVGGLEKKMVIREALGGGVF